MSNFTEGPSLSWTTIHTQHETAAPPKIVFSFGNLPDEGPWLKCCISNKLNADNVQEVNIFFCIIAFSFAEKV